MASFVNTTNPTAFGVYDSDTHFQADANKILIYVKRKLGDDIMSVELTNKQIWTNFEDATLTFSKVVNAHQAESYMSNLMGLDVGHLNTFKKDVSGKFIDADGNALNIQDTSDPRFVKNNTKTIDNVTTTAVPVADELIGPHGKEQQFPRETLEYLLRRAEPYANEANVGGSVDYVRGYIELKHDVQDYDIYENLIIPGKDASGNTVELKLTAYDATSNDEQLSVFNPIYESSVPSNTFQTKIKVNEVFHFSPQAAYRFFDTTSAINYLNNQFAFESFTPETVFYVLPVFEDLLRAGQLDISNRVRRSNFSYRLQGKDLRIFPRPTQSNPQNLFVKFSFPADPYRTNLPYDDSSITGVSNISNVPFANIKYSGINSMSRQWIKQFTLALCKETLGLIRSKFSSVPIPGSDLQMNGSDLLSQGREDKEKLITGLGETLDKVTYQKLLEADATQSESMNQILKRIPIPNGRAIIIG
tara:strand:- start:3159 stop:4580 length:1422 start_codon:yes stop_codon:yes gene_type:complete